MAASKGKKPGESGSWPATEATYDTISTLEELIALNPFTKASDGAGGSITIAARIPGWLDRKVEFLREMKISPYQLKSDVARDALYIGLKVLNMRYGSNLDWVAETKLAKIIDSAGRLTRIHSEVTTILNSMKILWEMKDFTEAVDLMEQYVAAMLEMPEEYERDKRKQFIRDEMLLKEVIERCNVDTQMAVYGKVISR